jgi:hypothetical protein
MVKLCGCKLAKSIPGLIHSVGLCQQHYNQLMFGAANERQQASGYMQAVYCTSQQWKQEKLLNPLLKGK